MVTLGEIAKDKFLCFVLFGFESLNSILDWGFLILRIEIFKSSVLVKKNNLENLGILF